MFLATRVLFVVFFSVGLFWCGQFSVLARESVTDWYIKDFRSEIRVNKDSTLDIVEKIEADCGNAPGKHGIFRILPERTRIKGGESINTPVELVSITDFSGRPVLYSQSRNASDKTVTWKIGDPDRTVTGVNQYEIRYRVKNAIRFGNSDFDELYWNLNGNFWDLEIDRFQALLIFPEEVSQTNSQVEYYAGTLGSRSKNPAVYRWSANNILEFETIGTLGKKEGVTASVTFPKNIFIPHQFSFWETYGKYFFIVIPFFVFIICFYLWKKYGDDPEVDRSIVPEYDVPGGLSPVELGVLVGNGSFGNQLITAEIINLAAKGIISIEELNEKVLFFNKKDYKFTRTPDRLPEKDLSVPQKIILGEIFLGQKETKLSSLKNRFYKSVKNIRKETNKRLKERNLICLSGLKFRTGFFVIGLIFLIFPVFLFSVSFYAAISFILSGLILIIFSFAMPKKTLAGAEMAWKIKGFRMFMETVDKHRAEFYEKENIFEKFLPYAIVFGITKIWIEKIKEIYGEEYFANHAPAWYMGANMGNFNADAFASNLNSLSSAISASTSAPSGSGGAGGSGGGGGGGGGGGW